MKQSVVYLRSVFWVFSYMNLLNEIHKSIRYSKILIILLKLLAVLEELGGELILKNLYIALIRSSLIMVVFCFKIWNLRWELSSTEFNTKLLKLVLGFRLPTPIKLFSRNVRNLLYVLEHNTCVEILSSR